MKCPYCLSVLEEGAAVCKVCTKDVYLYRPMMEKIHRLEKQLDDLSDRPVLIQRIAELEQLLDEERSKKNKLPEPMWRTVVNALLCVVVPLIMLLAAHALITVVYDLNILYLRILSLVVPWPFAFYLFKTRKRAYSPWVAFTGILALGTVIGMSGITSLVDHTPIFPQNMLEWREFAEYAASITLSFVTGMVVGSMVGNRKRKASLEVRSGLLLKVMQSAAGGKLSPKSLHAIMDKINEVWSSIVAFGATVGSAYTGLKDVM